MFIRGTAKLNKKTLNLSSIKAEVTSGKVVSIGDADFNHNEIQTALSLGLIERTDQVETVFEKLDSNSQKLIRCRNVHKGSLALNQHNMEIKSGQTFSLKECDLRHADIRMAVSKGMIEILGADNAEQVEEGSGDLKDFLSNHSVANQAAENKFDTNEEIAALTKTIEQPSQTRATVMTPTGSVSQNMVNNSEQPVAVVNTSKGVKWSGLKAHETEQIDVKAAEVRQDSHQSKATVMGIDGKAKFKTMTNSAVDDFNNSQNNSEISFVG